MKNFIYKFTIMFCFFYGVNATQLPKVLAVVGNRIITEKMVDDISLFFYTLEGKKDSNFNLKARRSSSLVELMRSIIKINLSYAFTSDDSKPKSILWNYLNNLEHRVGLKKGTLYRLSLSGKINREIMFLYVKSKIFWDEFIHSKRMIEIKVNPNEISQRVFLRKQMLNKPHLYLCEIFIPFYNLPNNLMAVGEHLKQLSNVLLGPDGSKVFQNIAFAHSGAASAKSGGVIGWVAIDNLPINLKRNFKKLTIGEVVGPLRESYGFRYYLIKNKIDNMTGIDENKDEDVISFIEINYKITPGLTQQKVRKICDETIYNLQNVIDMKDAESFKRNYSSRFNILIHKSKISTDIDLNKLEAIDSINISSRTCVPIINKDSVIIYHIINRTKGKSKDAIYKKVESILLNEKMSAAMAQEEQYLWTYSSIRITDEGKKLIQSSSQE